jgi:histidinol-phosphatase (PHP family)
MRNLEIIQSSYPEAYENELIQTNAAEAVLMDYHVHDYRSRDAPGAKIEDYVKRAEKIGVNEIAFTTHLIVSGPNTSTSIRPEEIPEYLDNIWSAAADTDVTLRTGFEVDYMPEHERRIDRLINEYCLDFVLGSVHEVNGFSIGTEKTSRSFFAGRSLTGAIDEYFGLWRQAIESEIFDVMSHPDYFRKHINTLGIQASWDEYGAQVYNAIDCLRSYGVGFEINTSGYRHGIEDKFPVDEFIQAAKEAGVRSITLGSDSHFVETLGYRLITAASQLSDDGFKTVSVYKDRREDRVPLSRLIRKS